MSTQPPSSEVETAATNQSNLNSGAPQVVAQEAKVGVGVLLVRASDSAILVGRRKGRLGRGDWALPGGHLDPGESFEVCAAREVLEETGIAVETDPKFAYAVNTVFPSGAHYVTIFMSIEVPADCAAQNLEPDKCEGWEWLSWQQVGALEPLFAPLKKLFDSEYKL